jgi:hypothetical protein
MDSANKRCHEKERMLPWVEALERAFDERLTEYAGSDESEVAKEEPVVE